MKVALFILGTRPEAIKLAPVIERFRVAGSPIRPIVCSTGQHKEMLYSALKFFGIEPDYDLALMKPDQSLYSITADALRGLEVVLKKEVPDFVIVQGDTTTALVGAVAGFYAHIPVLHVEAGLRSHDIYSPFPEEVNRSIIGRIAALNFAPTEGAKINLQQEKVPGKIHVVGNTVIDALLWGKRIVDADPKHFSSHFNWIDESKALILVTGHRRENFGLPFERFCSALIDIARQGNACIVYPVHLNPNVRAPVNRMLSGVEGIKLIEPVDYPDMIYLLEKCRFVITDSGGIQEEAPALGKPVLVAREVTERPEGVIAGTAKLVGTDRDGIVRTAMELLSDHMVYAQMSHAVNPYGDGFSSERILQAASALCAESVV